MIKDRKYICLNPQCPSPSQRVYHAEQTTLHSGCTCWVACEDGSYRRCSTNNDSPLPLDLSIVFEGRGIESIGAVLALEHWPQQLDNIFEELKQATLNQIEAIKKQKLAQFQQIIMAASKAMSQIAQNASRVTSDGEFSTASWSKLQQLQRHVCLNLNHRQKFAYAFEQRVRQQLRNACSFIQNCELSYEQVQERRRRAAVERANQFLLSSANINDKIQKLTTLLKTEMVKTSFEPLSCLFGTTCCLCQTSVWSPKEDPTKLGCLQQLLLHLVRSHTKQVFSAYMGKVLRYEVEELHFCQFISKLKQQPVAQLIVIDRENAGLIEKPFSLEPQQVWIQVVNKENKNLAKGPFIVADSKKKDASDTLISLLIYEAARQSVGRITLVTKDHFGTTLQEVLGGMSFTQLQCVEPQDFSTQSQDTAMEQ